MTTTTNNLQWWLGRQRGNENWLENLNYNQIGYQPLFRSPQGDQLLVLPKLQLAAVYWYVPKEELLDGSGRPGEVENVQLPFHRKV